MAKRTKNDDLHLPDVSNENYRLIKAGIKVYPVATNGKWKIHYLIDTRRKEDCK